MSCRLLIFFINSFSFAGYYWQFEKLVNLPTPQKMSQEWPFKISFFFWWFIKKTFSSWKVPYHSEIKCSDQIKICGNRFLTLRACIPLYASSAVKIHWSRAKAFWTLQVKELGTGEINEYQLKAVKTEIGHHRV